MVVVFALDGGTTAAGDTLVARLGGVGEIATAGALEEIPADRGHIAQLPRGAGQHRLRQRRVMAPDFGMGGELAVGDGRADAQTAVVHGLDPAEGKFTYVDELRGSFHPGLHQVDEVGAATETARIGIGAEQGDRAGDVEHTLIAEFPHTVISASSVPAVPSGPPSRPEGVGGDCAASASAARATACTIDT